MGDYRCYACDKKGTRAAAAQVRPSYIPTSHLICCGRVRRPQETTSSSRSPLYPHSSLSTHTARAPPARGPFVPLELFHLCGMPRLLAPPFHWCPPDLGLPRQATW
jgi:hypothetical protein